MSPFQYQLYTCTCGWNIRPKVSTMASKLTMSLDDIIKQSSGSTLKKKKPAPVKAESSDKKNFSKFQRKINRSSSPDDFPSRIRPPQPLKVITKERPRIIRPDDVQQPSVHTPIFGNTSTGTVFSRLGSNGFHVLFKNLKSTVRKEDIVELCRAVGEVRDLSFLTGFDSLGQARVLFSSKNFAEQCVQKYNGKVTKFTSVSLFDAKF